ncbi:MAG: DUF1289 domain-containing protein [Pseudomonadota bacterium]
MSTQKTEIPSPCISICALDADNLCMGCLRTIEEIVTWGRIDDDEKRQIWQKIKERRQNLSSNNSSPE